MGHLVTLACATAVATLVPLSGKTQSQEKQKAIEPPEIVVTGLERFDTRDDDRLTGEELLKALRRRRPISEVILPASASEPGAEKQRPTLLPEGSAVVDRVGLLARDGVWWTLVSDQAEGERPTKLLPNASLEVMVRTAGGTASPLKFVVSGEMSVFGGENYMLVRVVRRSVAGDRRDGSSVGSSTYEPGAKEPKQGDSADSGESTKATAMSEEVSVEDLLAAIQIEQPELEVLALSAQPSKERLDRGARSSRTLIPDGSPLLNRPGRLIRDGPWWTFALESDQPQHPEPPLKLLPNKSVELMLRASERGNHGVVFLVSGEVTVFEGDNFLLPRVAMLRAESSNLRK